MAAARVCMRYTADVDDFSPAYQYVKWIGSALSFEGFAVRFRDVMM